MTTRPTPLRLAFHLLDRQMVDSNDTPVGKVDDIELETGPDGRLRVVALVSGANVLGERIGGWAGRLMANVSRRLAPDDNPAPLRVAWTQVDRVDSAIHLSVRRELLDDPPLERWLCDHLIAKIPGAGDAG